MRSTRRKARMVRGKGARYHRRELRSISRGLRKKKGIEEAEFKNETDFAHVDCICKKGGKAGVVAGDFVQLLMAYRARERESEVVGKGSLIAEKKKNCQKGTYGSVLKGRPLLHLECYSPLHHASTRVEPSTERGGSSLTFDTPKRKGCADRSRKKGESTEKPKEGGKKAPERDLPGLPGVIMYRGTFEKFKRKRCGSHEKTRAGTRDERKTSKRGGGGGEKKKGGGVPLMKPTDPQHARESGD